MIKDFKNGDKVKYKRMDGNYAYGKVFDADGNNVLVEILPMLSNAPYAVVPKNLLKSFECVNLVESDSGGACK